MSVLYRTYYEYSRVIENVTLTEDGVYIKDRVPDDYSGSTLNVEIVHRVTMLDSTGVTEEFRFSNPIPMSKNKMTVSGTIKLDGTQIYEGDAGADPRTWTTRLNTTLDESKQNLGRTQVAFIKADREAAGGKIL